MKINKSLDIDLNILSPQKHIRIHEGDVDSVDILIGVTVDDDSVDLDGVTIKYDATINNYLAEQDADGSVVDGKISIPVTQNMTAMSGLLLIDVRMIQADQILFTQTIYATVDNAVVNGSTYIDLDKITINQRMNALEKKMEHVEEIVENFDTSKLIISTNRPPSGAPPEIDVDLLRVGDTWILSGENIVYKLVEAQYNYQPAPGTEPYHKFTWQPLNERYGVGNTDPPESVTYDRISYYIEPWHFSGLPVPEYFEGDQYKMLIGIDDPTYYICKSASMSSTGVCTYTWREEGGSVDAYTKAETNELLADKMDLAPLNPTAKQIAALPAGQLYDDSVNHKGVIKGGQEFYSTEYINENYRKTVYHSYYRPPCVIQSPNAFNIGDTWITHDSRADGSDSRAVSSTDRSYRLLEIQESAYIHGDYIYIWGETTNNAFFCLSNSMSQANAVRAVDYGSPLGMCTEDSLLSVGDIVWTKDVNDNITGLFLVTRTQFEYNYNYNLYIKNIESIELSIPYNTYTKTEIDSMVGDIETLLSEV